MLLKIFDKAILNNGEEAEAVIIDDDFQRRGNMIEARKPALFQARPETILDMFLHMASDSTIESVAPATMRQLRTARRRLNKFLHTLPAAREKFIELVRHPNALHKAFSQMHKLGVLAAYLPNGTRLLARCSSTCSTSIRWMNIVFVYSNISIYSVMPITTIATLFAVKFTLNSEKELLILAAIFHDIGKGRGGDHSEIGADEAFDFCIEHGLSKPEAKLVAWLVKITS